MTPTTPEQGRAVELLNSDSQFILWQAYCDRKEKCEDLADQVEALAKERDEYQNTAHGWIAENAPGGWIDTLRKKCAEYVKAADTMAAAHKVERDELQEKISAMCNAIPGYDWSGDSEKSIANLAEERDALAAAADSHKVVRDTLTARLNVLEAAAKLALDALGEAQKYAHNIGHYLHGVPQAITALRKAGVHGG